MPGHISSTESQSWKVRIPRVRRGTLVMTQEVPCPRYVPVSPRAAQLTVSVRSRTCPFPSGCGRANAYVKPSIPESPAEQNPRAKTGSPERSKHVICTHQWNSLDLREVLDPTPLPRDQPLELHDRAVTLSPRGRDSGNSRVAVLVGIEGDRGSSPTFGPNPSFDQRYPPELR